jgi:hypothetical protein
MKMRQTIHGATFEADGDESFVRRSCAMFHLAVAEDALRAVNSQLHSLRPLQQSRRTLRKLITELEQALASQEGTP